MRHKHHRTLAACFALLIFATFQHCAWEWAASLEQMQQAVAASHAGRPLPVGLPSSGCEHDSGCICRGATLAHGVDLADLQPVAVDVLLVEAGDEWPEGPTLDIQALLGPEEAPCPRSPISGRMLRALFSSLVI